MATNELKFKIGLEGAGQVQAGANAAAQALDKTGRAADGAASAFGGLGTAASSLRNLVGAVGVGTLAREFVQAADSVTVLNNQLKLATGSATNAASAYNALFGIAQRSRTSFTELGSTFASIARATDGLGISQQRLLKVTEAIGNAMAISGGSAAGMQAALTQLGQGLASGTLRGDELNSVLEQTPRLARAIADGMGVTVGQLRAMGQEGKITAETVIKSLESQAAVLTGEVQGAVLTVAQAWTVLGNSATKAIGQIDQATGTTGAVASQMQQLSGAIDDMADRYARARANQSDFINATPGLVAVGAVMATAQAHMMAAAEALGHVDANAANVGRRLAEADKELAALQKRFDQSGGFYLAEQVAQAQDLRDRLREAKAAQDALAAPDPRDRSGFATRSQSYDNWENEKAKSLNALAGVLNQTMGVNDSWVKQLKVLDDARAKGLITEREHIALAQKLTQSTYQKAAATKKDADVMGDAVKAYNDLAKAGRDWARGLATTNAGLERQQDLGRELTEAEKQHLELTHQLATGQLAMNAATEQAARAAIDYGQALRSNVAWQRQSADENARSFEALAGQTAGLEARAEAMRKANDAAGQTPAALREIEQAEHLANAAAKDRLATVFDSVDPAIAAEYRRQAAALREMGTQSGRAAGIESATAAGEAWQQMADDAGQALSNALMEGGKSAGDYIKGYFRSLIGRELAGMFSSAIASGGQYLGLASGSGVGAYGRLASAAGGMPQGNTLNTLYGAYNVAAGYLGYGGATAGAAAGTLGYANAVGALGGDSIAALYAANNGWAGVAAGNSLGAAAAGEGVAAGTGAAAGAGSAAAAAIPIIGWIIAAFMASQAAYKGGATHDMIDGAARYATPGGGIAGTHYMAMRDLGFSEKWATILSGEALVSRLLGHKASVSGFGIGSIQDGDFIQGLQSPIPFGANTLKGGADPFLQNLSSDIAAAVTLAASSFGGGLTNGLRVGAVTDRDRDNEVASLLGFFGADNKLLAGVQTGSGAFGAGGPGTAASKIAADDFKTWIGEQMPILMIQGLQQSDLEDRFDDYFDGIAAGTLTSKQATDVLNMAASVQQFADAFGPLGGGLRAVRHAVGSGRGQHGGSGRQLRRADRFRGRVLPALLQRGRTHEHRHRPRERRARGRRPDHAQPRERCGPGAPAVPGAGRCAGARHRSGPRSLHHAAVRGRRLRRAGRLRAAGAGPAAGRHRPGAAQVPHARREHAGAVRVDREDPERGRRECRARRAARRHQAGDPRLRDCLRAVQRQHHRGQDDGRADGRRARRPEGLGRGVGCSHREPAGRPQHRAAKRAGQ
jgi:tape measure domain-containing protein